MPLESPLGLGGTALVRCPTCRTSDGPEQDLCWPHLRPLLMRAAAEDARVWRDAGADRFTALATELRDYLHKCDWNFRHEPRGAEQDAWLRALYILGGARPEPETEAQVPSARASRMSQGRDLARRARSVWHRLWGERAVRPDMASVNLEAAIARDGCPICRLGTTGLRRWLWILLWEGVMDPEIRDRIRAGDGFCASHWWLLYDVERTEHHGRTGLAILEEDILLSLARQLRDGRTPGPSQAGCLACQAHRRSSGTALNGLARHLARASFREMYLASPGCCPTHRNALHARIDDPTLAEAVLGRGARL